MLAPVAAKGIAAGKFIATTAVGFIAFAVGTEWTHNLALAVVCQSVATVGAAYLMNRHKLLTAKSHHDLSLLDRLHEETSRTTQFMVRRLEQQNKLIAVLTITKHAFANELEGAWEHLQLRDEILKEHNIECPKFSRKSFSVLTQKEDEMRAEIAGLATDFVGDRLHSQPQGCE